MQFNFSFIKRDVKETLINTSTPENIIFLFIINFFLFHLRPCRLNKKKIYSEAKI